MVERARSIFPHPLRLFYFQLTVEMFVFMLFSSFTLFQVDLSPLASAEEI